MNGKWRMWLLSAMLVAGLMSAVYAQDPAGTPAPAAVAGETVVITPPVVAPVASPVAISSAIPLMWWIGPVGSLLALFFAWYFYMAMMKANPGNAKMQEIAGYVREGAMAYLLRQYKVVAIVFAVLIVILSALAFFEIQNPFVPVAFLTGGFFSGLCGFLGMKTATQASSRTAQGAMEGLNRGLTVAFRSGAVMGLVVVGFGLLDICLWYFILTQWVFSPEHMQTGLTWLGLTFVPAGCSEVEKYTQITTTMLTFGMGASTQALFARVGGGIYTKAADVGADLVGKVEAGIPEDDPRNPATIADNVGDNVGDVAGMGADLYESYCGAILATAALGSGLAAQLPGSDASRAAIAVALITAPMIVAGIGNILSIVGCFMVRCREGADQKNLLNALLKGTWSSSFFILLAMAALAYTGSLGPKSWGIFWAVVAGLAAGVVIGKSTEYYTSDAYEPTRNISGQARTGPATVIIAGLSTGMLSAAIPVVTTVVAILAAFGLSGGFQNFNMGLYGIGFSAVGMLLTLGITLATDAYGPIADNAGGNAEMSGLPKEVRERTDALDSLGNTTAATGKGFAIASAALTAMALLAANIEEVKMWIGRYANESATGSFMNYTAEQIGKIEVRQLAERFELHLLSPMVICGLFIGAMMVLVFCALTMSAVGQAAGAMVEEVRRQFREKPGIMKGTDKPDYARCVEISTAGAQKRMLLPSILAIIVPVATGLVLGIGGVMGLLAGSLATGFSVACLLNNAGGAWDNAKKYIEKGNLGGKRLPDGSKNPLHGAAVIGDTVGDPCKDTCGPSLNILLKLMSMVTIVFTPVILKGYPIVQGWLGIAAK